MVFSTTGCVVKTTTECGRNYYIGVVETTLNNNIIETKKKSFS